MSDADLTMRVQTAKANLDAARKACMVAETNCLQAQFEYRDAMEEWEKNGPFASLFKTNK